MTPEQKQALNQVKAVYDDGFAEINGREYHFAKMRHQQRRSVFAYFSSVQRQITQGNFSFLDDPAFKQVEKLIENSVTFDGSLLSKLPEHWEDYSEDYLTFVSTAMGVISYPFMRGSNTVSESRDDQLPKTTSKKPM
jgi:hypothetical protein